MSWLFRLPEFLELLRQYAETIGFWVADYCRFGRRWRKRTKFLTSCGIRGIKTLCKGCKEHLKLRGRSSYHRKSWTLVAQPYPPGVCKVVATSLAGSCNFLGEDFHFDPASCARCLNRIGEASHPGPAPRDDVLLEEIPLVEAKTASLQSKVWKRFENWLASKLSESARESILSNPMLLMRCIERVWECFIFRRCSSLHLQTPCCLCAEECVWSPPLYEHRSGTIFIDGRVYRLWCIGFRFLDLWLRALVSLSICWKWPRFAATLCLSFFGITRPGEVLRATRRDLLLPRDLLMEPSNPAFLRIVESKSRRHGKRRIQHASVLNLEVVHFLDKVFGNLRKDELLYPISGSSFRRRWDKLCLQLLIGSGHHLTPGSLRGGGALEEYRSGTDLQRILWRMRIRHLITLEHYVQEVAAESFLVDISEEGRRRIFL